MRIPSGVTDQFIYFVAVDATDLKTRETGLTGFTVYRSRDGGAAAAYTTPTVNETDATNMPGVYELLLDEDMTIGTGNDSEEVCLHITHASMAPVTRVFELYRSKITAGETIGVSSGAVSNVTTTATATAVTTVNGLAANVITAAATAADFGTEVGTAVWATTTRELTASLDPTAAAIADAVWDEAQADHVTAGSFGEIATEIAAILVDTGTTLDGLITTVDTVVDAIKVQTDKLTFTVANQVDANVQSINDTALTGDGGATPWGPA